jgi:hypothetical protein
LREMPFSRHRNATYSRHIRRNSLYICGKIGLTLCFLLACFFDAPDEMGKLEQISHAKGGATSCQHDTGIKGSNAGPGRWQRPDMLRSLVKRDAVFPPIVPVAEDLKLLAVQGMKRMGDRENSFCQRWRRCS